MPSYKISHLISMEDNNLPSLINLHMYRIDSICYKSGDYVKKGDIIMSLINEKSRFKDRIYIKSPCNGYISFTNPMKFIVPSTFLENKIDFYMTLEYHYQSLIKKHTDCFNYKCDIQKDLILNDYRLHWKSVFCIFNTEIYFQIEFNFRERNPILHFRYRLKEAIKVNDSLCFFAEKNAAPFLRLKVVKPPHKIDGKLKEIEIVLSNSDIDSLLNNKFYYLCIVHANGDHFSLYENSVILGNKSGTECLGQTISSFLFQKYVNCFKEAFDLYIAEYLPPQVNNISVQDEIKFDACYLYLMHDTSNGYYKIGMSKEPQYRERTLQSEKPSIELVCTKELPSRDIARAFESALHNVYAQKRIRGEWFELSDNDIAVLMKTLE